jgi:hypothetical protein
VRSDGAHATPATGDLHQTRAPCCASAATGPMCWAPPSR